MRPHDSGRISTRCHSPWKANSTVCTAPSSTRGMPLASGILSVSGPTRGSLDSSIQIPPNSVVGVAVHEHELDFAGDPLHRYDDLPFLGWIVGRLRDDAAGHVD